MFWTLPPRCQATPSSDEGEGDTAWDVAYVLFLNPEPHRTGTSGEQLVSCLVEHFGPGDKRPTPVHCELLVTGARAFFATYIGSTGARWYGNASDSTAYYLTQNGARWRAVPAPVRSASVQTAADRCDGAPYSMIKYLTSLRFARALARLWPDFPRSPAHCAVLTARVLKLAGCVLRWSSAWYAPGSLYNELVEAMPPPSGAS